MNFLQLCQRAALETGTSGSLLTTANQVGSLNRIITWVNQAWYELQTLRDDWGFMRSSGLVGGGASFTTVAGTAYYPLGSGAGTCGIAAANFTKWDVETFRAYLTSVGTNNEVYLDPIAYDTWRDAYMYGAMRTVQTRPVAVAIGPNKEVCLGPPPNALYTITADYFIAPTQMSSDSDTPTGLPARFHMMIVYKAMQYYAGYEAAPEVMDRGMAGYAALLGELEAQYLPGMSFAGALA